MRGLSELANLINEEFTKEGDREVLKTLRGQILSNDEFDNKAALSVLSARGISLSDEEFKTIRDWTLFEAQKTAKMFKSTGYTYIAIALGIFIMSLYIKNRLSVFGIMAAVLFAIVGRLLLKKAK